MKPGSFLLNASRGSVEFRANYRMNGVRHIHHELAEFRKTDGIWYFYDGRMVGTEQFQALATIAMEPERTQLFEKMATRNPGFAEYQRQTTRIIPVVILTRKS